MNLKETLAGLEEFKVLLDRKEAQHLAEADVQRMSKVDGRVPAQQAASCKRYSELIGHAIRHLTAKTKRQGFVPPTLQEIKARMRELGCPESEATKFQAFYESKGWKVGAQPMSSWKAATVTWAHGYFEKHPRTRNPDAPGEFDPDRWAEFLTRHQHPYQAFKYAPEFLRTQFNKWKTEA